MTFDTGQRIGEFEVWASEPTATARAYEFFLVVPGEFPTEVYQDGEFLGKPAWYIGFVRPDGTRQETHGKYKSQEEAQHAYDTYAKKTARLIAELRVCRLSTGEPKAVVPSGVKGWSYAPLNLGHLDSETAEQLCQLNERLWSEWIAKPENAATIEHRKETNRQVAHAVAADALPAGGREHGPTECLECGAVYDDPGHVSEGAMGCDRCD